MWGEGTVLDVDVGPNLYAYVRQNPWSFFDSLGLSRQFIGYVYEAYIPTLGNYIGSATYIDGRWTPTNHDHYDLLKSKGTTIKMTPVSANTPEGGWTESTRNHSLRVVEERKILKAEKAGKSLLNGPRAATKENLKDWAKAHGPRAGWTKTFLPTDAFSNAKQYAREKGRGPTIPRSSSGAGSHLLTGFGLFAIDGIMREVKANDLANSHGVTIDSARRATMMMEAIQKYLIHDHQNGMYNGVYWNSESQAWQPYHSGGDTRESHLDWANRHYDADVIRHDPESGGFEDISAYRRDREVQKPTKEN